MWTMKSRVFPIFFLTVTGVFCVDVPGRVIDDSQDRHLGYFLKSVEDLERPKKNEIYEDRGKIGHGGELLHDDCSHVNSVEPLDLVAKYVEEGRSNVSCNQSSKSEAQNPIPLHVTNSAREQCLEGYAVDENGVCQKKMQPKGEKKFRLRRRKRAEQTVPKLSYADVVKYGKNPPKHLLTTTMKADVLTTTPKTVEVKISATPTQGSLTTQLPAVKTTIKASVPVKTGVTRVTVTTTKPTVSPAGAETVRTTLSPSRAETVKPVITAAVSKATTVKPPVVKPPSGTSAFSDINQAFLSGEKSAVVAQSSDGKAKPIAVPLGEKKTVDVTRLRRSLGLN